jgi:N6-L-threonylcarbamoyladenine synthase
MGKPFCAFHVSGGTTEVLYVTPDEALTFRVEQVGGTADINAGQAIDRVGVMMGLRFPCGPALEELAKQNTKKVPKPRICVRDGICNLSGLENLAGKLYRESGDAVLTAAYVLAFIGDTLTRMTEHLLEKYPNTPVLYAGGVMSNKLMRTSLSKFCKTNGSRAYFAEPAFSADNAVGTSLLACRAYLADQEQS